MNSFIFGNNTISNKPSEEKNIDVAGWMRFLREHKAGKLFSRLKDSREQSKTTYSISSLAMWALSVCAFRQGSKNAFQTTLQDLEGKEKESLLHLLEIDGENLPHSSTVDHALSNIHYEELNEILLSYFDQLQKKKFFYNHRELLYNGVFKIGIDGYWVHKYDHPHSKDKNGNNNCPYCLPRTHNKGTPEEKTYYLHTFATCVLLCEGITLPLYIYPLKAKQVNVNQNDAKLKQECELKAAADILSILRKRYPRLPFLFLGDALYANQPFIQNCNKNHFDYVIVLKDNLKNINRKCDELFKHKLYNKHYTCHRVEYNEKVEIEKSASWFNKIALGSDAYTNVLRFKETSTRKNGKKNEYNGAWLCSMKLRESNCFKCAAVGRLRWDHENFHNTCKNRGFDISHDIARKNPNLSIVWKMITFIAFSLFEIFEHTTCARACRKRRSVMKFARDMLGQLITIAWEWIAKCPILCKERIQFRFHFGGGP